MSINHETAMDDQRRDLTQTFEQLIQQREQAFNEREKEIIKQIAALEQRFESLMTESARLKSELAEAQRRVEQRGVELAAREEQCRNLSWRLEDERQSSLAAADALARQLQQAQSALTTAKEDAELQAKDLQNQINQV